jgi:pimeloyl-ACP methyl ester carboxylesterase
MIMNSRNDEIIDANGVELCVGRFGDPADPPILLIAGTSASMDWWEDEFCARLAAGPRFVIRYDHRDTGRSVAYEPGAPGYTGADLTADAIAILDAVEVPAAHLVGLSAGGGIAQEVALDSPDRVASVTLISTSFVDRSHAGLPSMSAEKMREFAVPTPDWSDRAAVIDYITYLARVSASPARTFEEDAFRALAERVLDRSNDIAASFTNHDVLAQGDPPTRRLEELDIPALVIHGADDPMFPVAHGQALAEAIPGAGLMILERTGHELPPRETWETVVPAILALTGDAAPPERTG